MTDLPTGTVTFLFTDVEGSTKLLQELGDGYVAVQDDHMRLMRDAIAEGGGRELRTEGDAFFAVFPSAAGALHATVAAQRAFAAHDWSHGGPLRVRMGMHSGEGRLGGDDYLGIDVNRAARIAAAGHGGQVLLSDATRALVESDLPDGVVLRDLGNHRLKDLREPEHLYDVVIEGLASRFPALKTLEVPTTLPPRPTSFVGRERELDTVGTLLSGNRLVTLTGPGGTGKTRLAIEAAERLADRFPDGLFFVDLSPITDPRLVADTIAAALTVREQPARPIIESITDHLADRTALLVLDNFEQVLDGAATVATLLGGAPGVHAVVTSRAPLRLSGEREVPVPPLALPDQGAPAERLRRSEAVTLFAARALAVDPSFSLSDETVAAVARICARLDGLPLAIELAASRIKLLSPNALLERLERRLPLLTGGVRDAPERQRTLRATIEWSYDLLDEPERTLFRRLAVFAGGWTLRAAEDVATGDDMEIDALDGLASLIDKSLAVRDTERDREPRFRMLETIAEFAGERLDESGEADTVRERHARYFLARAEEATAHLAGAAATAWLDALSEEHDNLRAALRWATERDRADIGLALGGALWRFWQSRGHLHEGRRWLDALLALPSVAGPTPVRGRGLAALGGVAYWQNDFDAALAAYEEALAIHRELGDRGATAQALFDLGTTRGVTGDLEGAEALLQESLDVAREVGDRRAEAWALWGLGSSAFFRRDLDGARRDLEHSRRIFEQVPEDRWGLGNALVALAGVTFMGGDPASARKWVLQAIDLWAAEDNVFVIARQLDFMAVISNALGKPERALRLAGAAAAHIERIESERGGTGQAPAAFFPFPDPRETAAEMLGDDEAVERAWAEGRAMSLSEAVGYAREDA